ncbi:MAG TPA: serine hydrolase domain-containing protein [Steroidobacteraceae bacterium]|jgi:CubicO group peptidase (beta-lactamase class C family)
MRTTTIRRELTTDENAWSEHRMAAVRSVARNAVAAGDVPGVVSLVYHRGDIVHVDAIGLRDIEHRLPIERSTIFGIASMTKPVTVVLALTLLEEGKIRLDDPITRWLPEFGAMRVLRRPDGPLSETDPAPRPITVEDLMTHCSGLSYGFMAPGPLGQALTSRFGMGISSPLTPDTWLAQLAELPLAYAPGERFNYGHSTDVLGFLAARAAGTTVRDAFRQRVFEPLGMNDTDFWIPPDTRPRMAHIYSSPAPGQFTRTSVAQLTGDGPPAYASGGQGLVSTVDDYLTFSRMLLNKGTARGVRLLKPSTVELMTMNRLTPAQREVSFMGGAFFKGRGFGLGVSVVTDPAQYGGAAGRGSFGWAGAFGGWCQVDPENECVLLWLQECVPAPPTTAPTAPPHMPGARALMEFQREAYAALRG